MTNRSNRRPGNAVWGGQDGSCPTSSVRGLPDGESEVIVLILLALGCDDTEFPTSEGGTFTGDDYATVVEVFDGWCVECHRSDGPIANLDLETDPCEALVNVVSSRTVPYVVPGDHEGSVLWNRIASTGTYGGVMPPAGPMPQANIDSVAAWIDAGASCTGPVASRAPAEGGGW